MHPAPVAHHAPPMPEEPPRNASRGQVQGSRPRSGRAAFSAGSENGSVLILMPAAVLVLIVLGAIAVDAAVVFLGQREMADAAAAAANDAVSAGYREQSYYQDNVLCLSQARVQQIAEAAASARADSARLRRVSALRGLSEDGQPQVTVLVEGTVDLIFAPAVPGAARTKPVRAQSTAVLEPDPDATGAQIAVTQSC